MKRLLLCVAMLWPNAAVAQGTFKGYDELRKVQAQEYAETERQEKWMWLIGAIAVAVAGYVGWKEYEKRQKK